VTCRDCTDDVRGLSPVCYDEDMNYGKIKTYDIANGEGVRVTLFVSGCRNHCFNCFQPQTWDFGYGQPFDQAARDQIFQALDHAYIQGLTLLGGDPFEPENQADLVPFLEEVKARYPDKDIWAFTGYILDQDLLDGGRRHGPWTDRFLSLLDILVDGPFVQNLYDISLKFRGSSNQRIIDMKQSLASQDVILYLE